MRRKSRKLMINKETVTNLSDLALSQINGGLTLMTIGANRCHPEPPPPLTEK